MEMAQIEHLYNALKDMVGSFAVDNDGNFLIRLNYENKNSGDLAHNRVKLFLKIRPHNR